MSRTFNVEALTRNGRRIIATIVGSMKSTQHTFAVVDAGEGVPVDIVIVDDADPEMRQRLVSLRTRCPSVKVIYLVVASTNPGRRHELMGIQLVSHLMPMLEAMAKAINAAGAARQVNKPVPLNSQSNGSKIVKLVPKQRSEKLRALVVDDSPTVRMQLAKVIERMSLDCDVAVGGEAALQRLTSQSYDVIYVDVVMPDMDGYKLTREIKRNPKHKSTPVIILTSRSSPFDRARGALAGCDTYLTKPVELKRLYEATTQCVQKSMAVSDVGSWILDPRAPVVQPTVSAPSNASKSRPVSHRYQ